MGLFDAFKKKPAPDPPQVRPVAESFTCRLAGVDYPCLFPARGKQERAFVLAYSRNREPCFLQVYEWEGKPAIAVRNAKRGEDMGVIPAKFVNRVLKLCQKYDIAVTLQNKRTYELNGDLHDGGDVQILCYEKT